MNKILTILTYLFFSTQEVLASTLSGDIITNLNSQSEALGTAAGYSPDTNQNDLASIVATLIKSFLGLLAIIFVILIIKAGFLWMTASGNEEMISQAKKTLSNATIGLVITIAAYSITYFIFDAVGSAT